MEFLHVHCMPEDWISLFCTRKKTFGEAANKNFGHCEDSEIIDKNRIFVTLHERNTFGAAADKHFGHCEDFSSKKKTLEMTNNNIIL